MRQTQQNAVNSSSMEKESKRRYLDLDFNNTVVGLAKEFSDFCFGFRVLDPFYDGPLCRIETEGSGFQADILAVKTITSSFSPQYFIDETSPIINLNQNALNAGFTEDNTLQDILAGDNAYIRYLYNQSGYKNLYFSAAYASIDKAPKIAENGALLRTSQSNRPIAISHTLQTRLFSTYIPKIDNGGFFSVAKFPIAGQSPTTPRAIFASTNTGSLGDYFLRTVKNNSGIISYNSQASNLTVRNEEAQTLTPLSSEELYGSVVPNGNLNLCLIRCDIDLNFAGGKDMMLGFTPQANLDYPMYSICEVIIFLNTVKGFPLQNVSDNMQIMYSEIAHPNNP
jgi:hypothetical protein